MVSRSNVAWLAVLFACSWGCGPQDGTDVGNGATVSLELSAYENAPQQSFQSLGLSDGTTLTALWMVVDRIRLRPGTDCSSEDTEIDVQGPLVADLLNEGVLGGPPTFPVKAGSFCMLRVGFHALESDRVPAGAPPDLVNLSILMKGTRSDATPFVVKSTLGDEFELDARNGSFQLPPGATALFLAYDLAPWIAALNLGALSGSPIEVSDQQNSNVLQAFDDAVKLSARLFLDGNGDGELSTDEHTSGSELADGN